MKKTGKRLAAMILVSALAAALAGCGGKSSGEGSGTEKAEANKDGVTLSFAFNVEDTPEKYGVMVEPILEEFKARIRK